MFQILSIILIMLQMHNAQALFSDFFWNTSPTILFVHGLGGDAGLVTHYKGIKSGWQALHSFNLPHVSLNGANYGQVSLGQYIEMNAIDGESRGIRGDKILFGISMGAAGIINYVATLKDLDQIDSIQALILEAPYDAVGSVMRNYAGIFHWLPGIEKIGNKLLLRHQFPSYNPYEIEPYKVIDRINKDIPVLLIHSKEDELIPYSCSRNLYKILVKAGHTKVHLLELSHGKHANYLHGKNGLIFEHTVHAFYKLYGLPYSEKLLGNGQKILETTQPTLEQLKNRK